MDRGSLSWRRSPKRAEESLRTVWYSGIYPTSAGDALATYTNAQLWSALDYTKPFGSCGGETGYWAEPPMS
jgi:hypothetical protein